MPVHLGPHQTDLGQFQVQVQSRFKTGTAFYFKPFYMGSMVEGGSFENDRPDRFQSDPVESEKFNGSNSCHNFCIDLAQFWRLNPWLYAANLSSVKINYNTSIRTMKFNTQSEHTLCDRKNTLIFIRSSTNLLESAQQCIRLLRKQACSERPSDLQCTYQFAIMDNSKCSSKRALDHLNILFPRSFYCTSVLTFDATPSTSYRYFSTETPLQKPSYVTQLASVLPYHNPINTSSSTDQKTAPKWLPTFVSSCFLLSSRLSSLPLTANSLNSPLLTITVKGMEKKTSLHFYFHDISSGKNQTSTTIAQPLNMNAAANFFGSTSRADVLLREGPEPTSKLVGRAQGIYAFASQHNAVLLMVMNFAFVDGIYNGSSLSILGQKAIFDIVREMPVVGGSGVFRLARGFALAKTFSFNLKAGVAVIKYNVSVVHF
ncbi:hypothetical protein POTOM_003746 [Populus tomentosa]|uniref:Dirigent protein n=1 Tax=Populus tomentosa TaxID=118781 RepID=A0A8X8AE39_POPTO|nr:hypothetical protein POTOM_003746 [Populus tomentosa]